MPKKIETSSVNEHRKSLAKYYRNLRYITIILIVCIVGWGSYFEISAAIISKGKLTLDGDIEVVEHSIGGKIKRIFIKEGDYVNSGDKLIELDDFDAQVLHDNALRRLIKLQIQIARLSASLNNQPFNNNVSAPLIHRNFRDDVYQSERLIFDQHKNSSNIREKTFNSLTKKKSEQISLLKEQRKLILEELRFNQLRQQKLSKLYQSGNITELAVYNVQTTIYELQNKSQTLLDEVNQIEQDLLNLEKSYLSESSTSFDKLMLQLEEARIGLLQTDLEQAQFYNQLSSYIIKAGTNGTIHDLKVHTPSEVISAGSEILRIIPKSSTLLVRANINIRDIDDISKIKTAVVRFPSINSRFTPEIDATVKRISADVSGIEDQTENYYVADLRLDDNQIKSIGSSKFLLGMEAEVYFSTEKRSVLSFILKPITDQWAHALREP